ncbi:MAG: hypothetical protein Q4D21_01680 [Phascolarctobacterium sp.]|nr:hypothetical protein [Phascolarctobacterium sp.]
MAQFDGLDDVLTSIGDDYRKWEELAYILEIDDIDVDKYAPDALVKIFNKEIRHNYGHTLANTFRDEYTPDYEEILPAVYLHLAGEEQITFKIPDPILKGQRRTLGDFVNKPRRAQDDEILPLEREILSYMLGLEKYHSDSKHNMKAAKVVYLEAICGLQAMNAMMQNMAMAAPERPVSEEEIEEAPQKPQITPAQALERIDLKKADEEENFFDELFSSETLLKGIEKIVDVTGDTNWDKTIGAVALIAAYRMQMLLAGQEAELDAIDKQTEEDHRIGFKAHEENHEEVVSLAEPKKDEPRAIGFNVEK